MKILLPIKISFHEVVYIIACIAAILLVILAFEMAYFAAPPKDVGERRIPAVIFAVVAVMVWLVGRIIYHAFGGDHSSEP